MKAGNFDKHFGRISAFDLYTSDKYRDFVLVIATCPVASPLIHWAAKVLTGTALDFKPNPVKVDISVYDAMSKDNNTFTCVHTIVPTEPKLLMSYLKDLNLVPPDDPKSTLDISTLTLGQCLYRMQNGLKYIKVRISGYSVPFVMSAALTAWLPTETKQTILKNNRIGGFLLDRIYNALESRSTFIMERAQKKPLNLSMIDEYAKYNMWFYREPEKGLYEPAVKVDIAHPDYRPVLVFELGSHKHFALIEDQYYKITAFTSRTDTNEKGLPAKVVSPPTEARDGYFLFSDCQLLDQEDTFTIGKLERCIKNKL